MHFNAKESSGSWRNDHYSNQSGRYHNHESQEPRIATIVQSCKAWGSKVQRRTNSETQQLVFTVQPVLHKILRKQARLCRSNRAPGSSFAHTAVAATWLRYRFHWVAMSNEQSTLGLSTGQNSAPVKLQVHRNSGLQCRWKSKTCSLQRSSIYEVDRHDVTAVSQATRITNWTAMISC